MTNNAVAAVTVARTGGGEDTYLVSFLGLGAGKTWRDTLSVAYQHQIGEVGWRPVADVPGSAGRLASVAVAVGGLAYVFGGYTVAEDGSERSIETVHAYDPITGQYRVRRPMPIPVDDAVAAVHADRWIYLVSGWHDLGNVNLVQVYDTRADTWTQATPYPGAPVFGHAGGIVGNTLVIADGVRVHVGASGKRKFVMSEEAYIGRIDPDNHRRIEWHRLPPHPGPPRYRMAATGTGQRGGLVVFAGGSGNPYNYDGVGYDGQPSGPGDEILAFEPAAMKWRRIGRLPVATMDHRGLLEVAGRFILVAGMRAEQSVSGDLQTFSLPAF